VFPSGHHVLFNRILKEEDLKVDREGQRRTLYSLRHTYICLRLMEGADIYQIGKNCRTSVEMIEKFYASHIKTRLMPRRSTCAGRDHRRSRFRRCAKANWRNPLGDTLGAHSTECLSLFRKEPILHIFLVGHKFKRGQALVGRQMRLVIRLHDEVTDILKHGTFC
jgi:hypothetical protein